MTSVDPWQIGTSSGRSQTTVAHLLAAGAALGTALLLLTLVRLEMRHQLHRHLGAFAASISPLRNNGNLLQRAAFSEPGVLPVYGSSELDQPVDNRPDLFFRRQPTDFSVFPEGHAGTTCLMILQKIAAAGNAVRGKKTAVLLSPSWFARPDAARHATPASLPTAQLNAWVFDSPLNRVLKQKLARRLLSYPDALRDQPMTATAIRALAGRTWTDRWVFAGLWPLGECQHQMSINLEAATLLWDVCRHADEFRRMVPSSVDASTDSLPRSEPDWQQLATQAEARDRERDDGTIYSVRTPEGSGPQREIRMNPLPSGSRDAEFKTKMRSAEEWHDLKLLTEVCSDLGVRAMLISQPINGKFYDLEGISLRARQSYYSKLTRLVRPSGFPLHDYAGHGDDRSFFYDSGHPSAKAWIYYDQALDRFYHQSTP